MREFTVQFRSVQELSEFMALANQQPFDVLFVRACAFWPMVWMCRSSAKICSRIWRRARRRERPGFYRVVKFPFVSYACTKLKRKGDFL